MENKDEQGRPGSGQKQLPFNQLEQVDADRALALALQEQESAFTMLETIGSDIEEGGDQDDDEEEEDVESSSSNDLDSNLESQDFYELEFLEDEGGSDTDEVEEDEIDPDDMSYEELIALGEIVGEANRGLSIDEIASSLSPYTHNFVECKATIDR
ncbi:hypothetical protein KSS87_001557 [Heliosperma pusillum]|nr:hypothetical protein KSS87_001557 [Heliosperma pusillum]